MLEQPIRVHEVRLNRWRTAGHGLVEHRLIGFNADSTRIQRVFMRELARGFHARRHTRIRLRISCELQRDRKR